LELSLWFIKINKVLVFAVLFIGEIDTVYKEAASDYFRIFTINIMPVKASALIKINNLLK
jgi:hypothetical protein